MEIRKKSDLYNASVEEIETFFKNVVFKGQYSDFPHEREDKRFCGKIEHITIMVRQMTFVLPVYLCQIDSANM